MISNALPSAHAIRAQILRVGVGLVVGASLSLAVGLARADVPDHDKLMAQGLFDQALKRMDDGQVAEACTLFAESQKLQPAGGTLLNLALCHEKSHKFATASLEFEEALNLARREQRPERERFAREHLRALTPRISTLAISAPALFPPGAKVLLDDTELPIAAFGVPTPLDSGAHTITISAPEYVLSTLNIEVNEGETLTAAPPVLVPVPQTVAPVAPPVSTGISPQSTHTKPWLRPAGTYGESPLGAPNFREQPAFYDKKVASPWGTALVITGVVSLAGSGVTGGVAYANYTVYKNHCVDGRAFCSDDQGRSAASATNDWALASTVLLGIGIVTFIVGELWPAHKVTVKVGHAATAQPRPPAVLTF